MTGKPGILLDRDGTIIVDYHYVGHVERVQFIPGAIDAILRFNSAGIPVAIVTNQGGVARGFYPESNVREVHDYITRELALHGAHIDLFLYSPHHPEGNIKEYAVESNDHKPNPGMAYLAEMALDLELGKSWVVGDRITDVELARNVGADCVYLGAEPLPHWYSTAGIHSFPSLADAAGFIIERITGVSQDEFPSMPYSAMTGFFNHYADEVRQMLHRTPNSAISQAASMLIRAYNEQRRVFIAGNGGAAAIAGHFMCDHVKGVGTEGFYNPQVTDLTSNTAMITAIANDISYDAIFSAQLEQVASPEDMLVVFSVSGNSPNIVRAVQAATEMRLNTIAIVASNGGKVAHMPVNTVIHIPTGNYGVAEDVMQIIMHSIAQFIRQIVMSDEAIKSATF